MRKNKSQKSIVAARDAGAHTKYDVFRRRLMSVICTAVMLLSLSPVTLAAESGYKDIDDSYAKEAIRALSDKALVDGYVEGVTFGPKDSIKALDLDIVLARLTGKTVPDWKASNVLTREQAAKVITLAVGLTPVTSPKAKYSDDAVIGTEYKPYVYALKEAGYQQGDGVNYYPQQTFTREAIIQTIYNILGKDSAALIDADVTGKTYEGTVVIRRSGVTLKNAHVKGDLIVGQGVGDGEVSLDGVTVGGKIIAFGGGSHSIVIKGNSKIKTVVLNKEGGEAAHLKVEGGTELESVEIARGSKAIVKGNILTLNVEADSEVEIAEGSTVESVEIIGGAVVLKVVTGATVEAITIDSKGVTVSGGGSVKTVTATGNSGQIRIETAGTNIVNNSVEAVTTADGEVGAGRTVTTSGGGVGSGSENSGARALVTNYEGLWTSDSITVKVGVPVKWYVDVPVGSLPTGGMDCGKTIKIPGLGWGTDSFSQNEGHLTLVEGRNFVYEFTPTEVGDILFTCWMGSECHGNYIHVTADGSNIVPGGGSQTTVPGSPNNVTAAAGDGEAVVSFSAPASNGGSAISSYIVKTYTGSTVQPGITALGGQSPITVTGLTNGLSYAFTVTAVNAKGSSAESAPSEAVIPVPESPSYPEIGTFTGWFKDRHCAPTTAGTVLTGSCSIACGTGGSNGTSMLTGCQANGHGIWLNPTSENPDGKYLLFDAESSELLRAFLIYLGETYGYSGSASPSGKLSLEITGYRLTDGSGEFHATSIKGYTGFETSYQGFDATTFTYNNLIPKNVSATAGAEPGTAAVSFTAPISAAAKSPAFGVQSYAVKVYSGTTLVKTVNAANDKVHPLGQITVDGLADGLYSFTVTASYGRAFSGSYTADYYGSRTYSSAESSPSAAVTIDNIAVPGAPTGVTAAAGDGQVAVSFSAPASDGGSDIISYIVNTYIGGVVQNELTALGTQSPITVIGLTNGSSYTFTVTAVNAKGNGAESAPSAAATAGIFIGWYKDEDCAPTAAGTVLTASCPIACGTGGSNGTMMLAGCQASGHGIWINPTAGNPNGEYLLFDAESSELLRTFLFYLQNNQPGASNKISIEVTGYRLTDGSGEFHATSVKGYAGFATSYSGFATDTTTFTYDDLAPKNVSAKADDGGTAAVSFKAPITAAAKSPAFGVQSYTVKVYGGAELVTTVNAANVKSSPLNRITVTGLAGGSYTFTVTANYGRVFGTPASYTADYYGSRTYSSAESSPSAAVTIADELSFTGIFFDYDCAPTDPSGTAEASGGGCALACAYMSGCFDSGWGIWVDPTAAGNDGHFVLLDDESKSSLDNLLKSTYDNAENNWDVSDLTLTITGVFKSDGTFSASAIEID